MVSGKAMKTKKTETKKVIVQPNGTGKNYATAKDALTAFRQELKAFKHPEQRYDFLPPELAKQENAAEVKRSKLPLNRFFDAVVFLLSAFDAANKIVEESGNDKNVLNRIFNEVLVLPEIVRAIDDMINMPEIVTRDCLAAMGKANGGVVDCLGYSEILDFFLEEYENELIDNIRASAGKDKAKFERELENKRFEMFPIYFNCWTHNVLEGFKRFIVKTPFAKRCFPFHDEVREGTDKYGNNFDVGVLFTCRRKVSDFAPDENGTINIPLRGGGGCMCKCVFGIEVFNDWLKNALGIEDLEVSAPEPLPVADKPVSEYAARYVLEYQEKPEARFTFKTDDNGTYDIDLEHSLLCHVNFIKRLISESRTDNGGWVKVDQPEWLKHRDKLPKTIKPFVRCIEKRDINGFSSFRITGKHQEWAKGAPNKRPRKQ